jgi:hypothetical protein
LPALKALMINIDKSLVSLAAIEEKFTCDIKKCKGACCVLGESGAPLLEDEVAVLEKIFPLIKDYLQPKGVEAIEKLGIFVIDADDDLVTPLIDGKECAFTTFDKNGIAKCGIEKAWEDGKVSFRKPLSCHLYPIRIHKYKVYDAVNYDKWSICKPAELLGEKTCLPVYQFVKDALVRKYGADWFLNLETVAKEYLSQKNTQK